MSELTDKQVDEKLKDRLSKNSMSELVGLMEEQNVLLLSIRDNISQLLVAKDEQTLLISSMNESQRREHDQFTEAWMKSKGKSNTFSVISVSVALVLLTLAALDALQYINLDIVRQNFSDIINNIFN